MAKNDSVDVCVIGSGAGGGVIAKELAEKGLKVVLLEAGRRLNPLSDYTAALIDWERAGRENPVFRVPEIDRITFASSGVARPYEAFGVGGSTLRYLAYMVRLSPGDFRTFSTDGVGADWPLTYEDLLPYYQKVEMELQVAGQNGIPWYPQADSYPLPAFEMSYRDRVLKRGFDKLGLTLWPVPTARLSRPRGGRPACIQCGCCEDGCMSMAKGSIDVTYIRKAEATGKVEIRPESRAARITTDKKGRARSIVYFDKRGFEHEQEANVIILSAGVIQSPRLLLNSRSSLFPNGLGNSSGLVGTHFMQHISIGATAFFPDRIDAFRGFFGGSVCKDFSKTSSKNAFARGWALEASSGFRGPAHMAHFMSGWGASHKDDMRRKFGHVAGLVAVGEQLPDVRNRIDLNTNEVDAYGMPLPRLTYEARENDKLMLNAMDKKLQEILGAAGASDIFSLGYRPGASTHNMGTCRMGKDAKTSVLNSYCQTHDVPNLFVVDASCFVTGGTANPALTIMALATRSAEYIATEGRKGNLS